MISIAWSENIMAVGIIVMLQMPHDHSRGSRAVQLPQTLYDFAIDHYTSRQFGTSLQKAAALHAIDHRHPDGIHPDGMGSLRRTLVAFLRTVKEGTGPLTTTSVG